LAGAASVAGGGRPDDSRQGERDRAVVARGPLASLRIGDLCPGGLRCSGSHYYTGSVSIGHVESRWTADEPVVVGPGGSVSADAAACAACRYSLRFIRSPRFGTIDLDAERTDPLADLVATRGQWTGLGSRLVSGWLAPREHTG